MIEDKIQGRNVVETPEAKTKPVIDIMEALKRSLEQKRKPAQTATEAVAAEAEEPEAEEAAPAAEAPKKRARSRKAG
jgi:non-homologous end joining protein Ku